MSVQLYVHLFGQQMSAKKPLTCRTPEGGQLQDAGECEFSEAPSSHQRYLQNQQQCTMRTEACTGHDAGHSAVDTQAFVLSNSVGRQLSL